MYNMKSKIVITSILALGFFAIASAQSVSGTVVGGTTSPVSPVYCPTITQNLQKGDRDRNTNGQVSELQKFLNSYYSQNLSLGFFGPLTKKYVTKFQLENKLWGIGIVGPATRNAIAAKCGTAGGKCELYACPMFMIAKCPDGTHREKPVPVYDANGCQTNKCDVGKCVPDVATSTEPKFCTMQYDPVCGEKNGVNKTFGNQCEMNNAGYTFKSKGECVTTTQSDAPANCKVWYDGCNTCSRQSLGAPMACTLMYCFAHNQPYCKETF